MGLTAFDQFRARTPESTPSLPTNGGTVQHSGGGPAPTPVEILAGIGFGLAFILVAFIGFATLLAAFATSAASVLWLTQWIAGLWRRVRGLPGPAVATGILLVIIAGGGHAGVEGCHAHAHLEKGGIDWPELMIWLMTATIAIAGLYLAGRGLRDWRTDHRERAESRARSERSAEIERLKTLRPEEAKVVLLKAVRHADSAMREAALESLARQRSPETTELLLGALQDPSPSVQEVAMRSLAAIRHPAALGWLIRGLAGLGPSAIPSRLETLDAMDPDWRQRAEAGSPITTLASELTDYAGNVRPEIRSRLDLIDEHWRTNPATAESLPVWIFRLHSDDAIRRESAAVALGEIGHPGAKAALAAALEDKMSAVRNAARDALAKLRD